jgi:hypothetical protein
MRVVLPALAFLLLLWGGGVSASPETYKKWHDACLVGGTGEIDAGIRKFEARLAANPKDHLARAYLGSACALRAKAGFWGPTKLKYLKLGQHHLNDAVAAAPSDPRVRMIRAIGYFRVPKRFKVRSISISDFKRIIPVARDPEGGLKPKERQAILYYAHLAYAEEGEPGAARLRADCHHIDPASAYGKLTK